MTPPRGWDEYDRPRSGAAAAPERRPDGGEGCFQKSKIKCVAIREPGLERAAQPDTPLFPGAHLWPPYSTLGLLLASRFTLLDLGSQGATCELLPLPSPLPNRRSVF